MEKLPEHLGGGERRCHNDVGALQWAVDKWGIESMVDVGCGRACVVKDAVDMGLRAIGIDGDPGTLHGEYNFTRPDVPFMLHDYTEGPAPIGDEYDLAWTVEFLEHVDEKYMDNYMDTLQKCKYVICTFARPGDGGHHHVNEQHPGYWTDKFDHYGFDYDNQATKELRKASTMTKRFIRENGLVFVRRD